MRAAVKKPVDNAVTENADVANEAALAAGGDTPGANASVGGEFDLDFTVNGLQSSLELIRDPLTPRRSLKGLLMDKGELESQAMAVENTLGQLAKAMAQLKVVHRNFSLKYKCQYVTLTSIIDRGKSAKFYDDESQSGREDRQLERLRLEYPTLMRKNIALLWRANKSLAYRTQGMVHEFKFGRRVHLFEPAFDAEYHVAREIFTQDAPHFYGVLAAFEQIRVALNVGYKTYNLIGKDIVINLLELSGGGEEHFPITTRRQVQVLLEAMDRTSKTQDVLERLVSLVK